jgi:hypothetical protein
MNEEINGIFATRSRRIDITGQTFGHLTALEPVGKTKAGEVLWQCRCKCDSLASVASSDLRRGRTISCGCVRWSRISVGTHRESRNGRSPEYRAWIAMRSRCTHSNRRDFHRYGGRGITVCERWQQYELFIADLLATIGRRPSSKYSIDRIDSNGNYEPGNVRWATASQQRRNQRRVAHGN